MENLRRRNYTLELIKLFAAYMVVFIHVPFYGRVGVAVDVLARFAVPLFFVVSGCFSYKATAGKLMQRAVHILSLYIMATVCYTAWKLLVFILEKDQSGLLKYLGRYTNPITWVRLLCYNLTVSSGHLWYLLAVFYVYIIFRFIAKCNVGEKTVFLISFLLLAVQMMMGELSYFTKITVQEYILRNFLFMGIPFFSIGMAVRKYEYKIKKIPVAAAAAMMSGGAVLALLSRMVAGKNELYSGSLLMLCGVIILFTKYSDAEYPLWLRKISACSTYIYIFHELINLAVEEMYKILGIVYKTSVIYQMVHPLVICVRTTLLAYIILQCTRQQNEKYIAKN